MMRLTKLRYLIRADAGKGRPGNGRPQNIARVPWMDSCLLEAMFDPAWYLEQYGDAVEALEKQDSMTALDHYLTQGIADGRVGTPFFDAEWYITTYPAVPVTGRRRLYADALEHYVTAGCRKGHNPNPVFDEDWYRRHYLGAHFDCEGDLNGYHHFLIEGAHAGYNPSPLFDELWYRRFHSHVAAAIDQGVLRSGYHDYMRSSLLAERRPCPYFDPIWYGQNHPTSDKSTHFQYRRFLTCGAASGENPSQYFDENWYRKQYHPVEAGVYCSGYHHFLYEGASAGYSANPYFQSKWYCDWYPAVRRALDDGRFVNAFEHYLVEGATRGLSPNPYFNEAWYLRANPDVAQAVRAGSVPSGHIHYLNLGHLENREPSTIFDSEWYRAHYPDVDELIKAGLASSAYDHYCRYGRLVGRSTCGDFAEQWYLGRYPEVAEGIRYGKWLDGLQHFIEDGVLKGYMPTPDSRPEQRQQNITVAACAALELRDFLSNCRELICRSSTSPLVSVIMVLHNRAELTLRCLRSIVNWADVPYEVIAVDNDSHDETAEILDRVRGVRIIRNESNLHFLKAANLGTQAARGKHVLFLNNDSEIQVGALGSAARILDSNADVGAVGGKIILNNGLLQEAGSYLLPDGFSAQFGRGQSPFASEFMHRRDVPYCSGAFLMTPRRLFEDMGGFDTAFMPAYCEDVDYCMRLWQKGLRVVFNPDSILLHHETASSKFHRLLWPSVLRNVATLRFRYHEQLEELADYSVAPIGTLDGWRMRESYLLIVDSIEDIVEDEEASELMDKMLARRLFLSIYPLKAWLGERKALKAYIPEEVELIGGQGIEYFDQFCAARRNIYSGAVCLSGSAAVLPFVSQLREWLPKGCLMADEL